jgi:hypothetical protein
MKRSIPDRSLIRQYLLGRLDESQDLESEVSEAILLKDDVSEIADSIEDEIIEEYLEGTVDSADKNAVVEYFLRPAERREKLRFIRLLRYHFKTAQNDLDLSRSEVLAARATDAKNRTNIRPSNYWRSHVRSYAQLAALVLLCILSLSYISRLRNREGRLQSDLVRERELSANLAAEVAQLEPPMVALTLVSDRSRDADGKVPWIEVKPSTQRIIVEIALQKGGAVSYDVRLETKPGSTPIWAAKLLPIVAPSGDARLVFDVPTKGIESHIYSFVVSSLPPANGGQKYYDFEARITK